MSAFERQSVAWMLKHGRPVAEIAAYLGRHRSTLYRELHRNRHPNGYYCPQTAGRLSRQRRQRLAPKQGDARLRDHVARGLAKSWSPEQIAGRLKRRGRLPRASTETLYRLIYSPYGRQRNWPAQLALRKPKRGKVGARKRARYLQTRPLSERSPAVNQRQVFGHWEGDSVHFSVAKNQRHVTTLLERQSRYAIGIVQPTPHSQPVMTSIQAAFARQPLSACQSLTLDLGTEFSYYQILERKRRYARRCLTTYFCEPKSPWQKGSVENFNLRLRRFLPRDFDITQLTGRELQGIIQRMNRTPRKCLDFLTPEEAYRAACRASR
jgi:IS30 family transposase